MPAVLGETSCSSENVRLCFGEPNAVSENLKRLDLMVQVELPKRDGNGAQSMDTEGDEEEPMGKEDDATAALDYRSNSCLIVHGRMQFPHLEQQ